MAERTTSAAHIAERERLRALYAHLRAAAEASEALPGWRRTEQVKLLAICVAVDLAEAGDTTRDWGTEIATAYDDLTEEGQADDWRAEAWLRKYRPTPPVGGADAC